MASGSDLSRFAALLLEDDEPRYFVTRLRRGAVGDLDEVDTTEYPSRAGSLQAGELALNEHPAAIVYIETEDAMVVRRTAVIRSLGGR